jgi:HK97 family phage major capsid protein
MSAAARENRSMVSTERAGYNRALDEFDRLGDLLDASTVRYRDHDLPAPNAPEVVEEFRSWVLAGTMSRALQADIDTAGGYTTAPVEMLVAVLEALDNLVFVRRLATVHPPVQSGSAQLPIAATPIDDATWTSELNFGSFDLGLTFRGRTLSPYPLSRGIRVSNRLIRLLGAKAMPLVQNRLAQALAVPEEKAFLIGSGVGQPLGVFTAHPQGISTARDVTAGNTSAAIGGDGLVNALFSLKSQYLRNATWVFSRDAMRQIALLKDTAGRFLLNLDGDGDTILGRPVNVSEYAPATFTTGQYVGIVGDFSHYHIVDAIGFEIQRLVQRYALTNELGLIARTAVDAGPAAEEAFARITLA